MLVHQTLTPERCFTGITGSSKKKILEVISSLIAGCGNSLESEEIFAALIARERIGSTGIGEGIAIPHSRLATCTSPIGALIQLAEPLDFEAIDHAPVDLLFVLLVPEEATEEHLQILASLAEMMSQADVRNQLRAAKDNDALYKLTAEYALATP